ncbi:transposase [bacterium]|nr:MAG: transposase [bacterium]RIK63580.1 MAG: transposase [Planctomycetota bacterium]
MSDDGVIYKRRGANLPHWTREGAVYAVTFRLADSLPEAAVEKLRREARLLQRKGDCQYAPLSGEEQRRLLRLMSEKYQDLLDAGQGACLLCQDACAEIVATALQHFDGKRYRLWAWCVVPNHVHVVVQPAAGESLSAILHSWKSFTAKKINKLLGRSGALWQPESFDHFVRDDQDLQHCVRYVWHNPEKAGLRDWKWRGR